MSTKFPDKDERLKKVFEQFAFDEIAATGYKNHDMITNKDEQLSGTDIRYGGFYNYDIKHNSSASMSLLFEILEINNFKNPNGSKPTYTKGWFNKTKSKTDEYIFYMPVKYKGGILLEEFRIMKRYVMEFFEEQRKKYNIPADITSEEALKRLRELFKSNWYVDEFRINYTKRDIDQYNPGAERRTIFFLMTADKFKEIFNGHCETKYFFFPDITNENDIVFDESKEIKIKKITHTRIGKGKYDIKIER